MNEEIFKKVSNESLLIFDLDGTLINTDEVNFFAYKEAIQTVKKLDLTLLLKNHRRRFTRGDLFLAIKHLTSQEYSRIIEIKDDVYHKYLNKSEINTCVFDTLKRFSESNKVVLATNSHKVRADMVLKHHDLKSIFDHFFYKEDYKDDDNKFIHVLNSLNVDPDMAIVFENDSSEIERARIAGIKDGNLVNISSWGNLCSNL